MLHVSLGDDLSRSLFNAACTFIGAESAPAVWKSTLLTCSLCDAGTFIDLSTLPGGPQVSTNEGRG